MTEKRVEKKMNSYLKMILMMCLGGAIGAVFGVGLVLCEDGMAGMLQAFSGWMRAYVVPILWVFVAASLVVSIVCYRKAESYVQKMDEEDDSLMEELDQRYEAWSSAGMLASSVLMCLSMVIFAFGFPVTEEEAAYQRLVAMGKLLQEVIARSKGRTNRDLGNFADQIKQLIDKWEA